MHPVTRLGRVIQQLRSFSDMHANELENMAVDLDEADAVEVAARLRTYRDVQRDEAQMVVDELVDIQTDMATSAQPTDDSLDTLASGDPAVNSPRRARWLAEQAAEAERLRQPFSRRDLLAHGTPKTED